MSDTFDLDQFFSPEAAALEIGTKWQLWKQSRSAWEEEIKELRNYLYATDTKTTTNSKLDFKNSTTIPKLAQLQQNLLANYTRTLFPNEHWVAWNALTSDSAVEEKVKTIESYIGNKIEQQDMEHTLETILTDWINTGNAFGMLSYVNESKVDVDTGEKIPGYIGPKLFRISPHDIVFNPSAVDFQSSPKIIRKLRSLGELHKDAEQRPELGYTAELIQDLVRVRTRLHGALADSSDFDKASGYVADGFSNIEQYYNSGLVEILEFRGDFFDKEKFYPNHRIVVVDRRRIVINEPIKSWSNTSYIYRSTWRDRPDNLYGMGPLANLTGMQYKIDKLENARADVFDQILMPQKFIKGEVERNGLPGAPGTEWIAISEDASVTDLRPDATALQADLQIDYALKLMEELAGAPREAMGIRSPGEKTAFEVDKLTSASYEIFLNKAKKFNSEFLNPLLNDMLEMSRRFFDGSDIIRQQDPTFGADTFLTITKEDLTATGKLKAIGIKNFERKQKVLKEIQTIFNSGLAQAIDPHVSKIRLAKLIELALDLSAFDLIQENIGILEAQESQAVQQSGQSLLDEQQAVDEVTKTPPGNLPQ